MVVMNVYGYQIFEVFMDFMVLMELYGFQNVHGFLTCTLFPIARLIIWSNEQIFNDAAFFDNS